MIYILTGISGCGKTTIGNLLAEKLNIPFHDADDYHPQSNIEKMSAGYPLTDEDRAPWLEAINRDMRAWSESGDDVIVGCSALKHGYRNLLSQGTQNVQWIQLEGPEEVIEARMSKRSDHFFDSGLLHDQVETVEFSTQGWHYNIEDSPESIVNRIMDRIQLQSSLADFGVVGLGVMGQNLVLNCADSGMRVAAFNRHVAGVEENVARDFVDNNSEYENILPFDDVAEFVQSMSRPRKILLMVKAGKPVDAVIDKLSTFLQAGDMIIDGGNSHYRDTERRQKTLHQLGIKYVGMGISGGEYGARNGPSMMPGVSYADTTLKRILDSIAAVDNDGLPCWTPVGPGGAGHFVKMIHNGIEYAEMQLIAECHLILRSSGHAPEEIASTFKGWRAGVLDSYLLEISVDILRKSVDGRPALDLVSDMASHKGTGKWSVEAGLDLSTPSNSIYAALFGRQASSQRELRTRAQSIYSKSLSTIDIDIETLAGAYSAARLLNHIIGFEIIREASVNYGWNINLSEIARIWTNGCIIRSKLMEELRDQLKNTNTDSLLLHEDIAKSLSGNLLQLRTTVSQMVGAAIPIPCFTSCLTYFDSMTHQNSSAHIIAAQRDFFGAHGFTPREEGGPTHINWTES